MRERRLVVPSLTEMTRYLPSSVTCPPTPHFASVGSVNEFVLTLRRAELVIIEFLIEIQALKRRAGLGAGNRP